MIDFLLLLFFIKYFIHSFIIMFHGSEITSIYLTLLTLKIFNTYIQ
jgi:hypothetical protein